MDRVRFGRALGMGARDAARAMLKAADAATSPNPSPNPVPPRPRSQPPAQPPAQPAFKPPARAQQAARTVTGIKRGSKRFGEAIWGPIVHLSGVVWLEITGVLFALFAVTAGLEVWKHRADLHAAGPARNHLLFAVLMLVLFAYFTLSSFFRANRRTRR